LTGSFEITISPLPPEIGGSLADRRSSGSIEKTSVFEVDREQGDEYLAAPSGNRRLSSKAEDFPSRQKVFDFLVDREF
jgi:hypothetical protein